MLLIKGDRLRTDLRVQGLGICLDLYWPEVNLNSFSCGSTGSTGSTSLVVKQLSPKFGLALIYLCATVWHRTYC